MAKKIFITGTGTDIGKTYISGLIVKKIADSGRKTAYYKAAMSGNDRAADGSLIPGDALFVKNTSKIPQSLEEMCPYVYENAVSPHLASRIEGNPVDRAVVLQRFSEVCEKYEYVTMEGSGGILCPICYDQGEWYLWEMVKELGLSCIMIADAGLGTINSVVLTYEFMKQKGIEVKGIIYNHYHKCDVMEDDNIRMCEHLTGLQTLGCVCDDDNELNIDIEKLLACYS